MDEDNKNDWLAFIDGNELTTHEVEIIEEDKKIEKKIEKLNIYNYTEHDIMTKVNEIIDKLNEMEKE